MKNIIDHILSILNMIFEPTYEYNEEKEDSDSERKDKYLKITHLNTADKKLV